MSSEPKALGPRPPIGLGTKIMYSTGSAANTIKQASLSMLLLLFYNQVVGLDPRVVSTAILITMFFDAVVDPLIGQVSDNFRSRLGRRHPFMYFAAVPVSITFFLLWNPPMDWSHSAIFGYMLTCLLIIRAFDTFFELPSTALAPELVSDYDGRTRLLALRSMFGAVGTLSVSLLVYQVFMKVRPDGSGGVTERDGYMAYSICAAILIFSLIIFSSAGTHRQIPWLSKPPVRPEKLSFIQIMKEVFQTLRNRNFAVVAVGGMVLSIGTGIMQSLSIYMGLFYWRLSQNELTVLAIAAVLSNFVGVALAPQMVKRVGKRVGAMITGTIGITMSISPIIADQFGLMPPRHSEALFITLVGFAFCTQAFMISTSVQMQAMVADVVEDSAMRTGRRSEGLLFSADNLFKKAISGVGVLAAGQLLHFAQFPANARVVGVSPEVANHLGLMVVAALVIFYGGSLVMVYFYGITRANHESNLKELERKAGEAAAPKAAPAE